MASKDLKILLAKVGCGLDQEIPEGIMIKAITADSRKVEAGSLFIAIKGQASDGNVFVNNAIALGAVAIITEKKVADLAVPQILVTDSRALAGHIAAAFYDYPAEEMVMIAITGTNGKTTCSYLLEDVLSFAGLSPGVIGTINCRYGMIVIPAKLTTPEPIELQGMLAKMRADNVTHVVMETSSIAIEQGRLAGINFDVAAFTNLSRDHLDFHGDMEQYYSAKKRLFTDFLKQDGVAVVMNGDNTWSKKLQKEVGACVQTLISCGDEGNVRAIDPTYEAAGITAQIKTAGEEWQMTSPLVGSFNLENLLTVVGCGEALKLESGLIKGGLAMAKGAPGRMERVSEKGGNGPTVFVDYAHTPDALENAIKTIQPLTGDKVTVVFGCGGDRDQGKREIMGKVATENADLAVATSDNPRSEEPMEILYDIEKGLALGVEGNPDHKYLLIESREEAISHAISKASSEGVVLLAGKGHEDYQITNQGKIFFDDRLVAKKQLSDIWGEV